MNKNDFYTLQQFLCKTIFLDLHLTSKKSPEFEI